MYLKNETKILMNITFVCSRNTVKVTFILLWFGAGVFKPKDFFLSLKRSLKSLQFTFIKPSETLKIVNNIATETEILINCNILIQKINDEKDKII